MSKGMLLFLFLGLVTLSIVTSAPVPLEEDGNHIPYTYGWSDGDNEGIPPGLQQALAKASDNRQQALNRGG